MDPAGLGDLGLESCGIEGFEGQVPWGLGIWGSDPTGFGDSVGLRDLGFGSGGIEGFGAQILQG